MASRAKSPEPLLTTLSRPDTQLRDESSDLGDSADSDEEGDSEVPVYEIERIEAHKDLLGGKRAFFVRWKNYGDDDRTWEPEEASLLAIPSTPTAASSPSATHRP